MLSHIKNLARQINKKATRTILLIVLLPIITLRLLGLLESLEWTAYDLLFYFSPTESKEERIVLVTWEERDIQTNLEMNVSDRTLASVLKIIKAQKPRIIGLDLYRDIPYFSNSLEKQQNEQAYDELQEIFRSTPNLIGVEKVGEPFINPPPALKKKDQVSASDIIIDSDNIIRRGFIAKQLQEKKDAPESLKTIPYLGIRLGMEYLVKEGFSYQSASDGSLVFSKNQNKITLDNLKTFDGGYINNDYHLDFLIHWRKGNNLFETISITDLLSGKFPPAFFKDKIVLIGNVAASTADRHNTTLTRWNDDRSWTHGLFVLAHVTSSIISANLDGRSLIQVAPWGMGYLLLIISVSSTAYFIYKYYDLSTRKLYLTSALFSLILTILLSLSSLIAFQALGWWMPIVPAILGVWLTFITINNQVQIKKEQENALKLELISVDLNHEVGNFSNLVKLSTNNLKSLSQSMHQILAEEHEEERDTGAISPEITFQETKKGQILESIKEETTDINQQINIIKRYKKRTTQFIELTCSRNKPSKQITSVNDFVKQIVKKITQENTNKFEYEIKVEEIYAHNLKSEKINRFSLEIIIENLINNASDAVAPQANSKPNYFPTIKIETNKKNNWIEIGVRDNGVGMSKQRQSTIFDPYRTYKIDKGQGIGLTLVKQLLKLEGGNIKVESTLGKGSKFTVTLPTK